MADQVYNLSRSQARPDDVCFVKKDNAAPVADAAIAIVFSVDRSIKLVMTANCHHQKLIRAEIVLWQLVHGKVRLTRLRVEDAITRGVRKMEAAGLAHAFIVVVEAGHDALDRVANLSVVARELFPVNGRAMFECRAREPRHDLWFTQKLR